MNEAQPASRLFDNRRNLTRNLWWNRFHGNLSSWLQKTPVYLFRRFQNETRERLTWHHTFSLFRPSPEPLPPSCPSPWAPWFASQQLRLQPVKGTKLNMKASHNISYTPWSQFNDCGSECTTGRGLTSSEVTSWQS